MGILAAIKYREGKRRMANTEETNENIVQPDAGDIGFVIKEEICSETDSPPESPINRSLKTEPESSEKNLSSGKDNNQDELNEMHADNDLNDDSDSLKIDEDNYMRATSDENTDGPVDYSQKNLQTSKSEGNSTKTIIPNIPVPFSPFIGGLKVGVHAIPFTGGILYERGTAPLLHNTDGKQMRPFKAYNATRDLGLSGLPSLAGYAIPVGGKIHGSSTTPIRISPKISAPLPHGSTNGTSATPPSTHLMTLATEADKLRQRECENGDEKDADENGLSEDGMTSDGNDSYKDDINEFYPQGLQESEKKKGKKRKSSLEQQMRDDTYWERRRKNNEAAKRSRDARRAKEDQIAIRAALLEQENMRLRIELAALKEEMVKLRGNVYGKNGTSS